MGHGITELSDLTGIFLFAAGVQMAFFTQLSHQSFGPWIVGGNKFGPVKPFIEAKGAGVDDVLSLAGSLMIIVGFMLYTIRWDKINGKLPGIGLLLAAFNFASLGYRLDKGVVQFRVIYVVAGLLATAGLRLFFHRKSEDADFLYLKEHGKKEAELASKKTEAQTPSKDKNM